jgi:hypothetical protein
MPYHGKKSPLKKAAGACIIKITIWNVLVQFFLMDKGAVAPYGAMAYAIRAYPHTGALPRTPLKGAALWNPAKGA